MEEVRRGPLCWAQHWFWMEDWVLAQGESHGRMLTWSSEIPGGVPIRAVRQSIARVRARHEALRTVYRRDEEGRPIQVVVDGVDLRLIVVGDGGRLADHLPRRFDLANASSFTAVARVRDGRVHELCLAVHRIVLDGLSWTLVQEEVLAAIHGGQPDHPGEGDSWQPLDQAAAEAAAVAGGAAARSARYWERELAAGAHATLPIYWDAGGAPSLQTIASMPKDTMAVAARRYGVTIPTAAQALLAVICAGWTGHPSCAIGSATANRVRTAAWSSVGRYASMVRVVLGVDPALTFQDYVQAAHQKLLAAYKRAPHDVGAMTMREARHSARIGARIISSIFFEYHHYMERRGPAAALRRAAIGADPLQLEFAGHAPQLRCDVIPVGDTLRVSVCCWSRLLDGHGAKEFLAQYRELTELVAAGDITLGELLRRISLPAPWDAGAWVRLREAWINVDDVVRLLREHPDVETATVSIAPATDVDSPGTLVARVTTGDAGLSAADLEDHMRDRVSGHPTAMVPHRYLISPARGATARPAPPPDDRESALVAVFRACHDGRAPVLADTYAQAGGEFLRIPDMLAGLARAGYGGVVWNDFIGLARLRTIAAKLAPQRPPDAVGAGRAASAVSPSG